jgi:hypothetical protein
MMAEAIAVVLAPAGKLRARDIHAAVEAVLREPVSRCSVNNCLTGSRSGRPPLFERVGRGRYRLVGEPRGNPAW